MSRISVQLSRFDALEKRLKRWRSDSTGPGAQLPLIAEYPTFESDVLPWVEVRNFFAMACVCTSIDETSDDDGEADHADANDAWMEYFSTARQHLQEAVEYAQRFHDAMHVDPLTATPLRMYSGSRTLCRILSRHAGGGSVARQRSGLAAQTPPDHGRGSAYRSASRGGSQANAVADSPSSSSAAWSPTDLLTRTPPRGVRAIGDYESLREAFLRARSLQLPEELCRDPSSQSAGLLNISQCCYVAAVVQVLVRVPALVEAAFAFAPSTSPSAAALVRAGSGEYTVDDRVMVRLQALFAYLRYSVSSAINVQPLLSAVGRAQPAFLDGGQHDPHEFIQALFKCLHRAASSSSDPAPMDALRRGFLGATAMERSVRRREPPAAGPTTAAGELRFTLDKIGEARFDTAADVPLCIPLYIDEDYAAATVEPPSDIGDDCRVFFRALDDHFFDLLDGPTADGAVGVVRRLVRDDLPDTMMIFLPSRVTTTTTTTSTSSSTAVAGSKRRDAVLLPSQINLSQYLCDAPTRRDDTPEALSDGEDASAIRHMENKTAFRHAVGDYRAASQRAATLRSSVNGVLADIDARPTSAGSGSAARALLAALDEERDEAANCCAVALAKIDDGVLRGQPHRGDNANRQSAAGPATFRLRGVITHLGEQGTSGHYVAFVEDDLVATGDDPRADNGRGEWLRCDDARVAPVVGDERAMRSSNAKDWYAAVYQRDTGASGRPRTFVEPPARLLRLIDREDTRLQLKVASLMS